MDDVQPKAIAAALPAVTSDFILAKMFNALVWPTSRKSTSGHNPATRASQQENLKPNGHQTSNLTTTTMAIGTQKANQTQWEEKEYRCKYLI